MNPPKPQEFVFLTEEKIQAILNEWNSRPDSPPSLLELTRIAFPDRPELDGRTKEAAEIKKLLATRNLKAKGAHEYTPKERPTLSDDQKEFIKNNVSMMSGLEIAKVLFNDTGLIGLGIEARTVNEFIKTLTPQEVFESPDEIVSGEYKAPRSLERMIFRINKYILEGIDKDKITAKQKKEVNSLINYVNTYRFLHQINSYESQVNRDLFESSFIRYTNDKSDLTQEEVDQYIILSNEVVISSKIQKRAERLQGLLDNVSQTDDENVRISMSLVEAINTAQNEYNQCVKRQQTLLGDLKEKRSDRLKNQIKENASILNLVQLWKEEESRVKLLKLAELRRQNVKDEIQRLSSMDEIKCRILGISEEEILDG